VSECSSAAEVQHFQAQAQDFAVHMQTELRNRIAGLGALRLGGGRRLDKEQR